MGLLQEARLSMEADTALPLRGSSPGMRGLARTSSPQAKSPPGMGGRFFVPLGKSLWTPGLQHRGSNGNTQVPDNVPGMRVWGHNEPGLRTPLSTRPWRGDRPAGVLLLPPFLQHLSNARCVLSPMLGPRHETAVCTTCTGWGDGSGQATATEQGRAMMGTGDSGRGT